MNVNYNAEEFNLIGVEMKNLNNSCFVQFETGMDARFFLGISKYCDKNQKSAKNGKKNNEKVKNRCKNSD